VSRAGLFMFAEGEQVALKNAITPVFRRGLVVGVEEREGGKRWYEVRWPGWSQTLFYHEYELETTEREESL
jgi:hypothetical protein